MAQDYTVKVFNEFYNLDITVNASEYDLVYTYFRDYVGNDLTAKSFTEILFRISSLTDIPITDLLQSFQTGNNPSISRTLAYYLNSVSNKTVLFGVNAAVSPNQIVNRNVVYDSDPSNP
jgi:hypothetical protein